MNHQLLIEIELDLSKNPYSDLLQVNEIPRGSTIPIKFYVTNLGIGDFNGDIKQIGFSFNNDKLQFIDITNGKHQVPITSLPPKYLKERRPFCKGTLNLMEEGIGWFKCVLKPYNEEDQIEYLTDNGNKSLGTESWLQMFQVINREQLEIIRLLKEIINKSK